jgi:inhibitor of cysteine peptidase
MRIRNLFIILFIGAVFMAGCAKPYMIITDADNGKGKNIPRGEQFWIKLPAQLGTGYSWKITSPESNFESIGSPVTESSGSAMPGGSEHQIFKFKANKAEEADLNLEYIQPWEKNFKPAKSFTVKIKVEEGKK